MLSVVTGACCLLPCENSCCHVRSVNVVYYLITQVEVNQGHQPSSGLLAIYGRYLIPRGS